VANFVFNIAKGKVGYYTADALGLAGANSRVVIVVLETSEADDTLNNYDDLATLIAGTPVEWTATNYARIQLAAAAITFSVDDTANSVKTVVDADQTWNSVTGNASVDLLMTYDSDNTGGGDASIIPLTCHDWVVTPNGGNITADFDQTNGFWGSS
jgi:hypothetical protein